MDCEECAICAARPHGDSALLRLRVGTAQPLDAPRLGRGKTKLASAHRVPEGAIIAAWGEYDWSTRRWHLPDITIDTAFNAAWEEAECMCGSKVRRVRAVREIPLGAEITIQHGIFTKGSDRLLISFDGGGGISRTPVTRYMVAMGIRPMHLMTAISSLVTADRSP